MPSRSIKRTSNVEEIFPDRANNPASSFTYEELMQLDAGTWFNIAKPGQARSSFTTQKQYISTLEDLIMIAEGRRIKRDAIIQQRIYSKVANNDGTVKYTFEYETDPSDVGHRPGIYIETKEPSINPGIEQALYSKLDQLSWNIITTPASGSDQFYTGLDGKQKVNIGYQWQSYPSNIFTRKSDKSQRYFCRKRPYLFPLMVRRWVR